MEVGSYYWKKSKEITDGLIRGNSCELGLLAGDLAWCVFLNESAIKEKGEYILKIIEKQVDFINSKQTHIPFHIHKGLGSLHLIIYYLGLDHIFSRPQLLQLNQNLYRSFVALVQNQNYDFLYGSSGVLLSFMYAKVHLKEAINLYIDSLWDIYLGEGKITVRSPKTGVVNFGLAHGICAVSQILIYARKFSIQLEKIDRLLKAIGDSLIQKFVLTNRPALLPVAIEPDGNTIYSELLGWCSGRLSYGLSLLNIADVTGCQKYSDIAFRILEEALFFSEETIIYDKLKENYDKLIHTFSLCHGVPSKSLLFKICYEKTSNRAFLEKHYFYQDLITKKLILNDSLYESYEDNNSLLYGTSGIFLALLYNDRKRWRELLLLF